MEQCDHECFAHSDADFPSIGLYLSFAWIQAWPQDLLLGLHCDFGKTLFWVDGEKFGIVGYCLEHSFGELNYLTIW